MTAMEETTIREVIHGCDQALEWICAEVARLQRSLDDGISLETLTAINGAILRAKAGK